MSSPNYNGVAISVVNLSKLQCCLAIQTGNKCHKYTGHSARLTGALYADWPHCTCLLLLTTYPIEIAQCTKI